MDFGSWFDNYKEPEPNGKTIVFDVAKVKDGERLAIENDVIAIEDDLPGKIGGLFTNVYKVTDEFLKKLSTERFVSVASGGTVDIGAYILSLYVYPFKLDDKFINPDMTPARIGTFLTSEKTNRLKTNIMEVDIGKINIPHKYNNVYDYINTVCYVNIPYVDKIEIEPNYCIGHTVSIKFIVDLFTGESTLNIYSTFNNSIIHTEQFKLGYDIPITQVKTVLNQYTTPLFNKLDTSFIEVIRNIPYDVDTKFGKDTVDYGRLGDYKGYIEVENVLLNVPCTENEKEQIKNILKSGINIK